MQMIAALYSSVQIHAESQMNGYHSVLGWLYSDAQWTVKEADTDIWCVENGVRLLVTEEK